SDELARRESFTPLKCSSLGNGDARFLLTSRKNKEQQNGLAEGNVSFDDGNVSIFTTRQSGIYFTMRPFSTQVKRHKGYVNTLAPSQEKR
ncbi:uncharacterized, partial [Tachysurus ichikawai]